MASQISQTESWQAAEREGLSFFWVWRHVGGSSQFVGQSWEDGGFHTNDDGDPVTDGRGNTIAKFTVEQLDHANPQHVAQVEEWWG